MSSPTRSRTRRVMDRGAVLVFKDDPDAPANPRAVTNVLPRARTEQSGMFTGAQPPQQPPAVELHVLDPADLPHDDLVEFARTIQAVVFQYRGEWIASVDDGDADASEVLDAVELTLEDAGLRPTPISPG